MQDYWNWQNRWQNNMEISVALGGGGIRGVAHIGVLEALENAGFKIRAVAGTSVGGLVGAAYCSGYRLSEILDLLDGVSPRHLYARQPGDGPSLMGYAGLAEIMIKVLGESQFSDLKIPFACTAVDIRKSQEVYFNQGRVIDAVLATMAIPGVFPPKRIGEAELIDGGVLDPVPVTLARFLAPHLPVVAVALNKKQDDWGQLMPFDSKPLIPLPLPTPLAEGFSRMRFAQALGIFMRSLDLTTHMLTELRLEVDRPEVIIRPDVEKYSILDFVMPRELVEVGRQVAEEAIPSIHQALTWSNYLRRAVRQPPKPRGKSLSTAPKKPDAGSGNPESTA